jgi:predicted enzyme related to lactoylglutathione lyase
VLFGGLGYVRASSVLFGKRLRGNGPVERPTPCPGPTSPASHVLWLPLPDASAHTDRMPVRLHHIVVDAHDLPGLARFWTQALGWKVLSEREREREIVIGPDENAPVGICFMPVTDPKTVKNRLHLDLTTSAQDRDQEIERLLALGARRAGIGQTGAESWTVLADPEGNEFCVIRPKETLIR